ncbi:MAG: carboxymuconolactone decarboxylase family protein [Hyphomicrobiales bacterium]
MARYLVVAHQTGASPELRRAIERLVNAEPEAEFGLLVPATPVSHMFTWNDGETLEVAQRNAQAASEMLLHAGANVTRTVIGSRVPLSAIDDEVREGPGYDGIVICTFPAGMSRWLKLDIVNQARKRTGLPVTHVVADPTRARARPENAVPTGGMGWLQPEPAHPRPGGDSSATPQPLRSGGGTAVAERPRTVIGEEEVGSLNLPHVERADLPEELHELWDKLDMGDGVADIFRVMGNNPGLLRTYVQMLNALWHATGIDPATRELAILRVASLCRSQYLWHSHVRIAREHGVSDDRIRGVNRWQASELAHFDRRDRAVFAYVDAVVNHSPEVRERHAVLSDFFPLASIIALNLLAGFYQMTAQFAEAMDLQTGERFIGWDLY